MRLFWRHGYEGVSFQHLTAAIGVAAPSLYAAFGNKESLYFEALDRYAAMRGANDLSFMEDHLSLQDAIRRLLERTAAALIAPGHEVGCMLNTGMVVCHPDHEAIRQDVARRRAEFRRYLAITLTRWVDSERADKLARYLLAIMQGMAIQARDGVSLAELMDIAAESARPR